jgi:hypothetical protein
MSGLKVPPPRPRPRWPRCWSAKTSAVLLPITVQPDVIRAALAAGKHILSEKPVAPDVASGAALIAEYRATYLPKGLVWVRVLWLGFYYH